MIELDNLPGDNLQTSIKSLNGIGDNIRVK